MKTANKELAKQVVEYINSGLGGKLYTFTAFFTKMPDLDNTVLKRGSSTFFKCPFHEDNTPSFGFNDSTLVYHCFSCGSGGSYINFLYEYYTKVQQRNINFYQLVDELLRSDPIMQAKLGINTIMVTTDTRVELSKFKKYRAHNLTDKNLPTNYLELSTLCLKKKITDTQKILMISLMQSGLDVKLIYKEIFNEDYNVEVNDKIYDITAVLAED